VTAGRKKVIDAIVAGQALILEPMEPQTFSEAAREE
jgi:predicted DNA-binding protein (UPF0251 family)